MQKSNLWRVEDHSKHTAVYFRESQKKLNDNITPLLPQNTKEQLCPFNSLPPNWHKLEDTHIFKPSEIQTTKFYTHIFTNLSTRYKLYILASINSIFHQFVIIGSIAVSKCLSHCQYLLNHFTVYFRCALMKLINPLVEPSWLLTASEPRSSGWMTFASSFPSSTLGWSKVKEISQ